MPGQIKRHVKFDPHTCWNKFKPGTAHNVDFSKVDLVLLRLFVHTVLKQPFSLWSFEWGEKFVCTQKNLYKSS